MCIVRSFLQLKQSIDPKTNFIIFTKNYLLKEKIFQHFFNKFLAFLFQKGNEPNKPMEKNTTSWNPENLNFFV